MKSYVVLNDGELFTYKTKKEFLKALSDACYTGEEIKRNDYVYGYYVNISQDWGGDWGGDWENDDRVTIINKYALPYWWGRLIWVNQDPEIQNEEESEFSEKEAKKLGYKLMYTDEDFNFENEEEMMKKNFPTKYSNYFEDDKGMLCEVTMDPDEVLNFFKRSIN